MTNLDPDAQGVSKKEGGVTESPIYEGECPVCGQRCWSIDRHVEAYHPDVWESGHAPSRADVHEGAPSRPPFMSTSIKCIVGTSAPGEKHDEKAYPAMVAAVDGEPSEDRQGQA